MAKPIVIVSCLDTKGREVEYCKQIIEAAGVPTMVIDVGVFAPPLIEPDIPREEVCSAIGACWQAVQQGDKTHRIETIIAGITAIVCELQAKQQIGDCFPLAAEPTPLSAPASCRFCRWAFPNSWCPPPPAAAGCLTPTWAPKTSCSCIP